MSLLTIMLEKVYTKKSLVLLLLGFFITESALAWSIDLSRRRKELQRSEASIPMVTKKQGDFLKKVFPVHPRQEIVILNTESGFVPDTVRVKKGGKYKVHVVNINKENKNVSFIMDDFGEHHGTFFGKVKSFEIDAKNIGVFSYQCPETAFDGRFVVMSDKTIPKPQKLPSPTELGSTTLRTPASE
ncbi:MAG: hypothetical protein AB8E15_09705 [Bdellovibrionales bacterium]